MLLWISALIVVGMAAIHLFAGRLSFLNVIPRSRWLSIAGGMSVAYIFVHLLPDLSQQQETFRQLGFPSFFNLQRDVYLVALLGLLVFSGLERVTKSSRSKRARAGEGHATSGGVFWLHIGSFALYNALIGYLLLHREEQDLRGLIIYAVAMAAHFFVNDYGLRDDHMEDYHRIGRWLLAAAVMVGWLTGVFWQVHGIVLAMLFGFLSGGVVLNILKEELPEERESRFYALALGAVGYAIVLLLSL